MDTTNQKSEWQIDNLPNRLTIFRIVLIPIILGCLFLNLTDSEWIIPFHKDLGWIAGWTFVAASITDFFDGYFARKRGIVTVLGSFLDPMADKFLVVSSLIMLQGMDRVPVIIVIILVLREMYINSLRLLANERGFNVPVGQLGKWKTAFQMVGIPLLMAYDTPWGIPMPLLGTLFIYLASIFSLYSALEYSVNLLKNLKLQRQRKLSEKSQEKNKNTNPEGTTDASK
ncbi:MAG: CDP-diacylglycerol--glycerol-3-phosphate 3-phosphatidyltransferase [Bacteriovoracaceae bacterium]|nr:CDP-diacylglycerol--glycerol-3-phosphate 3-phosphatidyltransferase [Bacteriovoracaceae bacterium]